MRKPKTWCLEPDYEGRDGDPDEIYWGYALNYDPQQGPLNIQANRVMVVEHSAYARAIALLKKVAEAVTYTDDGVPIVNGDTLIEAIGEIRELGEL